MKVLVVDSSVDSLGDVSFIDIPEEVWSDAESLWYNYNCYFDEVGSKENVLEGWSVTRVCDSVIIVEDKNERVVFSIVVEPEKENIVSNVLEVSDIIADVLDLRFNKTYSHISDNLREVKGDLNLNNSCILQLPDNLKVGGCLYLNYSSVQQLPDNLEVGGDLELTGSLIEKLPDNLHVGGVIWDFDGNFDEIPEHLKSKIMYF